MKTNKLIVALALPLAFAACSNEEIIESQSSPVVGANLVEVDGIAVGLEGLESRGLWEAGTNALSWSWIPEVESNGANAALGASATYNVIADGIGLCWTGELADGTGSISNKVYTNYQFLHAGWLKSGATSASFDPCMTPGEAGHLINGIYYSEVDYTVNGSETFADLKSALKDIEYTRDANSDGVNELNDVKMNYSTGVFATENKAIFGGSYVVYSPYNPAFADAACLPASSPVVFDEVPAGVVNVEHLSKNTFLVGYAKNLVGGTQASKLSLDPLSSIASIQFKSKSLSDDPYFGDNGKVEIKKIALWSENGFVSNVALDAAKIKANGALAGEELYVAGTKETSNTIVATLVDDVYVATSGAYDGATKIYLPLLPTTANNLKVIVYADVTGNNGVTEKIAVISLNQNVKFEAGQGKIVSVPLSITDFTNAKIAVDQESLEAALTAGASSIIVAGDIILTDDLTINQDVTISGDDIIVPANKTMTVSGKNATSPWKANIKSKVIVESEGCCEPSDGKLVAMGLSSFKDVDNMGTVEVKGGTAEFNGTFKNYVDAADRNQNALVKVMKKDSQNVIEAGVLSLNGKFENESSTLNEGTFNMNNGSEVVNDGLIENKNLFTNNSSQAKFQNNATYVDMLGGLLSGKLLTNNKEYICDVDNDAERLNYALEKRTMVTTVRFVAGGWYKFNDYAGYDFSHLKFVINAAGENIGFHGCYKHEDADGKTVYDPLVLKVKSLTVNSNIRINRSTENTSDGIYDENCQLSLVVKEGVTVNAGTLSFERPVLSTIGTSLTLPDWKSGKFNPINGAMLEIGNKASKNGQMYIGRGCTAEIGNNVKINVYGYVDKNTHGSAKFYYTDATGNGSVAGEVRCDDYNGAAGWSAGHAPVIDKYFVFK